MKARRFAAVDLRRTRIGARRLRRRRQGRWRRRQLRQRRPRRRRSTSTRACRSRAPRRTRRRRWSTASSSRSSRPAQGRRRHGQVRVARRLDRPGRHLDSRGQTAQNARKAAQDDKAVAYIGEFNSGASAISIPILNEAGIPQISPGEHVRRPDHRRAGRRAGRAGQVLPDGQAQLRAHRPEGHDPGRRARDGHEGGRLHEGRHRQRQGGLRRRPRAQHRARRQGAGPRA